ncbi:MAG: Holliday junction resolvase RuvX [Thermomicrobiales bacterium]
MNPGRIIGLDIGGERIGVAISDEMGILASPLGMIRRTSSVDRELDTYIRQYQPVGIVAGLPIGLSGREGPQAKEVREYTDALAERAGMSLEYWDERLTTSIAERSLIGSGVRRKERRDKVDAIAASVILQGYLDHARWRKNAPNR